MKIRISKQVYDQFDGADKRQLQEVPCDCKGLGCEMCEGAGVVWEWTLGAEESAGIRENFSRQGIDLGKIGTH